MKQVFSKILIISISTFLSLLLGEVALRSLYHYLPNYDYEMWRYASELKQPLPYAGLPFHHFPNKAGRYYGVDIRTNSQGFRDREHPVPKPKGSKRILFLGDSFTLGWGVPLDDTCSKQLERRLDKTPHKYDVINMGIGNYNSAMETELFLRKGLELGPDIIVLMYFANDMEPTPKMRPCIYPVLKRFYLPGFMYGTLSRRISMMMHDDELMEYYRGIYSEGSPGRTENTRSLRELIQICNEKNMRMLIVNIPELRRLKHYPFSFATDHIRNIAKNAGVPFLDLLPVFVKYDEKSLWVSPEDPHMNTKANSLAAGALYEKMLQTGLLD